MIKIPLKCAMEYWKKLLKDAQNDIIIDPDKEFDLVLFTDNKGYVIPMIESDTHFGIRDKVC